MTLFIKPHIQSLHAFTGMFRNRPLLTYDIAMWFCSNGMATSFNRDMDFWFATFCLNTPTIISNSFPGVKDGIYDETKCVIQQKASWRKQCFWFLSIMKQVTKNFPDKGSHNLWNPFNLWVRFLTKMISLKYLNIFWLL